MRENNGRQTDNTLNKSFEGELRDASYERSVSDAEKIVGDYDWQPLSFESKLAPSQEKILGQRKPDMGPVTRNWPEDGFIHIEKGPIWACGVHKYEAIAVVTLPGLFWSSVIFWWWATSLIIERIPTTSGLLLSWAAFGVLVFISRWVLLHLTRWTFTLLQTMIAAKWQDTRGAQS